MEDKELLDIFIKGINDSEVRVSGEVSKSEARLSAQISELKTDWQGHVHPDIIQLKQAHVDAENSHKKLLAIVTVVSAIIGSVSTLMARILIR